MVNISDFYKKEDKSEPGKVPPKAEPAGIESASEKPSVFIPKKEASLQESPSPEPVQKTSEIIKDNMQAMDKKQTKALYDECLGLLRQIFQMAENNQALEPANIKEKVDALVDQVILDNYYLLGLTAMYTQDSYLFAHCLNVCIISVLVGKGLEYDKRRLQELGFAAFLYDVGMVKVLDISQKPGKLTDEEFNRLKEHPLSGAEFLGLSKDIISTAIYVAQQHHEYINGKGYPKGLTGNQINDFAKIVAICDHYEAITHPRSYRDRLNPYEALRELLKDKECFDYHFLKIFIQQMGVYPIGSTIQLSSGEIGAVIKTNRHVALRPVVKIEIDSSGRNLQEEKIVDLSVSPILYIKRAIERKNRVTE